MRNLVFILRLVVTLVPLALFVMRSVSKIPKTSLSSDQTSDTKDSFVRLMSACMMDLCLQAGAGDSSTSSLLCMQHHGRDARLRLEEVALWCVCWGCHREGLIVQSGCSREPGSGITLLALLPFCQPSSHFAQPVVRKSQIRVTCDMWGSGAVNLQNKLKGPWQRDPYFINPFSGIFPHLLPCSFLLSGLKNIFLSMKNCPI